MYLKRVVMHGFKSFADRTVVELDKGVTAIVGPNGCGKSNIADGIKWVLGEQSPKAMRATSMQDVLFEGADTRPAMSFCEVQLTFAECEAQLGTAYAEVEVARRVERDGGSEYYINGKACRLKDIQGLFRDTGIGRVSYSFLQQGQIDKLLSSNPVDRRAVFEEAAGISGFKAKREETLKKLGETEANLGRVGDILTEVSGSMASLKRQASKAVRAQRLKRQGAALDQALVAYDLSALKISIEAKEVEVAPQSEKLSAVQATLAAREDELKKVEGEVGRLLEEQQQVSGVVFEVKSAREEALSHAKFLTLRAEEAQNRLQGLQTQQTNLSAEAVTAGQQEATVAQAVESAKEEAQKATAATVEVAAAYESAQKNYEAAIAEEMELRSVTTEQEGLIAAVRAKLGAMELEAHGLRASLGPVSAQKESLVAERDRLAEEERGKTAQMLVGRENLEMLTTQAEQTATEVARLKENLAEAKENFEKLQRAHMEQEAEKSMLESLNRRYEGLGEATKKLLGSGEYVALVEGLEVEPSAIKAVEALLSLELDAVCAKGAVGLATLGSLKAGERVALPQLGHAAGETAEIAGLTPAANFIKASPAFEFIRARLEGCYVCADEAKFAAIVEGAERIEFVAVVNNEGAMIDSRGLYTAAHAAGGATSFLDRSARLKELESVIAGAAVQLQEVKAQMTTLDHVLADTEATASRLRADKAAAQMRVQSLEAAIKTLVENKNRVSVQLSKLDEQTAAADARLSQIDGLRRDSQEKFDELNRRKNEGEEKLSQTQSRLSETRSGRDSAYTAMGEAKLKEAGARHALEAASEQLKNLKSRISELTARLEGIGSEIARLEGDLESYHTQAAQKTAEAAEHNQKLDGLNASLDELKAQLATKEGLQANERAQLEMIRGEVTETHETLMRLKMELNDLQTRRSLIVEDFARHSQVAPETLNWRACLYEAEVFAKADEATLEEAKIEIPVQEELEARYNLLDRESLNADCQTIRGKLEGIGPINENALEDYRAQETRYTTLKAQADDLNAAKTELATALMELNAQSSTLFTQTFETIRANFGKTFEALFGGGKADLELATPEDPLNSGIEIVARPPGTQLKTLGLLSGGQRTMTAVALLFAIYQVKPSPFCVLDELDAPLDDANIGRFLAMLRTFTAFSQFLMITHNKRSMAACDVLYGVTMQERGVSKLLSMRLAQAETYSKPAPKVEEKPSDAAKAEVAAANADAEVTVEKVEIRHAVEVANTEAMVTDEATERAAESVAGYSLRELEKKMGVPAEVGEKVDA